MPETTASVAYGFFEVPFPLSLRPSGGTRRIDIGHWIAGKHDGNRIEGRQTRPTTANLLGIPAFCFG